MFRLSNFFAIFCAIFIANFITQSSGHAIEQNDQTNDLKNSNPWINDDLFKRALQKDYLDKKISIQSFSLKSIPAPNINYKINLIQASVKFEINGKENEKKFVIKYADKRAGDDGNFARNTIKKEIENDQQTIPAIRKILASIGEDDYTSLR